MPSVVKHLECDRFNPESITGQTVEYCETWLGDTSSVVHLQGMCTDLAPRYKSLPTGKGHKQWSEQHCLHTTDIYSCKHCYLLIGKLFSKYSQAIHVTVSWISCCSQKDGAQWETKLQSLARRACLKVGTWFWFERHGNWASPLFGGIIYFLWSLCCYPPPQKKTPFR